MWSGILAIVFTLLSWNSSTEHLPDDFLSFNSSLPILSVILEANAKALRLPQARILSSLH